MPDFVPQEYRNRLRDEALERYSHDADLAELINAYEQQLEAGQHYAYHQGFLTGKISGYEDACDNLMQESP